MEQKDFLKGGGFKKVSSQDFLSGGGFKIVGATNQTTTPQKPSGWYRFGRAITPLGESLGTVLALPEITKQQEGIQQQQGELTQQVIQRIKDPNITKERKEFYIKKLQEINPDIISQDPELSRIFSKTAGQVIGEAGVTTANILAGGVKLPTAAAAGSFQLMPYTAASFIGRLGAATAAGTVFGASAALAKGKTGKEVAESGAKAGLWSAGIVSAFEAVPHVIDFFKGSLKRIGSAISGSGLETIDTVIKNPEQALKGLKGDDVKLLKEAATAAREQVSTIHKEAVKAYGDDLAEISKKLGKDVQLDKSGIQSFLTKKLEQFGVSVEAGNFTESPFSGSEEKVIKKALNYINDWTDLSPEGLNKLAIKVGRLAKAGTQSQELNNVIYSTKSTIREYIGLNIPEISKMNADYASKMQFIEALKNELSVKGATDNVEGIIKTSKKIGTIFGNNKELARDLIEKMQGGVDLLATEAGRQIARPVTGASVSLKYLLQAIIPPKLVGEIAAYSGIAAEKVKPVVDALGQLEPAARQSLLNVLKQANFFD